MDEPPSKRLKADLPPLPAGWTEHTAPSGHKYYYNKATKKSTYTRPVEDAGPSLASQHPLPPKPQQYLNPDARLPGQGVEAFGASTHPASGIVSDLPASEFTSPQFVQPNTNGHDRHQPPYSSGPSGPPHGSEKYYRPPKRLAEDRPKRKEVITDFPPWILVYTKLGRRFVHNTETKESFWKFPPEVMTAVIAFDQQKLSKKYGPREPREEQTAVKVANPAEPAPSAKAEGQSPGEADEKALAAYEAQRVVSLAREKDEDAALLAEDQEERIWVPPTQDAGQAYDSSEYEEVEVTDSEGEEPDDAVNQPNGDDPAPLEFDEDDIAYQLAAMGESYGLDPEEYGDGGDADASDPDEGGLPLSDEDRYQLFAEMLTEHNVSPYTPWEKLIDDAAPHAVLDDDRFVVLTSSRARKEGFGRWARERAAQLKVERRAEAEKGDDARTVFLRFLAERGKEVGKLYWVEFRRRNKREAELKGGRGFGEKEMERVYREVRERLKGDGMKRRAEFEGFLGEMEKRGMAGEEARTKVRGDARFWVVEEKAREDRLEEWLAAQR